MLSVLYAALMKARDSETIRARVCIHAAQFQMLNSVIVRGRGRTPFVGQKGWHNGLIMMSYM